MEAWLAALEGSWLAATLKASFVVYPLVNAFHILSIGALVTGVVLLDIRVLGGFSTLAFAPFTRLMRQAALLGFAGAVSSGLALFSVGARDYAANPAFLAKLALIGLAGASVLFLTRGPPGGRASRLAAGLSMLLWPAALVAGRFIGFLQ